MALLSSIFLIFSEVEKIFLHTYETSKHLRQTLKYSAHKNRITLHSISPIQIKCKTPIQYVTVFTKLKRNSPSWLVKVGSTEFILTLKAPNATIVVCHYADSLAPDQPAYSRSLT